MLHISSEKIQEYLDSDKTVTNLKRVSQHLDKCIKCSTKLKNYASVNILIEIMVDAVKKYQARVAFGECPSPETIYDLSCNLLTQDNKQTVEQHVNRCAYCTDELKVFNTTDTEDPVIKEAVGDEISLPRIIRYIELYSLSERQPRAHANEAFAHRNIWEKLFTLHPVLVPMGFADHAKRDSRIYGGLDDAQLMEACKRKDNMAWEQLERRFRNYALAVIRGRGMHHLCEDIWQDSLISLCRYIDKYKEEGKAKEFIRRFVYIQTEITRRKEMIKDKWISNIDNKILEEAMDGGAEYSAQLKHELSHIYDNMNKMADEYSEILFSLLLDLSDEDLAKKLGLNIATVRSRKFRARVKLSDMKANETDFMDDVRDCFQNESFIKSLLHS